MRTINDVGVVIPFFIASAQHLRVILTRLVGDRLNLAVVVARDCLRLVDAASVAEDSLLLSRVVWLMVHRQIDAHVAAVIAHDGPAVANIDDKHTLLHE